MTLGPTMSKVWRFLGLEIKLKNILIWKTNNFHMACPKATKQSPYPLLCTRLSIHTKNATS